MVCETALIGKDMNSNPIPVTLLTGFLGSGKTTLLTRVLQDPRFGDTAVVVNEFGEVGLDGMLVEHSHEQLVEMTSGCLCCTIRGDIRETLHSLHGRREQGDIPAFNRLVVESTGLADPAPVIHTLMTDPRLAHLFMLGGVVATVDALTAEFSLAHHTESVKQVAVADRIVLTKTDMMKDADSRASLGKLRERLRRLNPGAVILDRNDLDFDLRHLFDTSLYDPETKGFVVQRWLNAEAYGDDEHSHHHHHGHGHHHHHGHEHDHDYDVNRHGDDIRAFSLVLDQPIEIMAFTVALELLIANQGADLLRVKGIVNLTEKPGKPVVIHGVQHIFHEPIWLDAWPDSDRRSKIVFITRNIAKETIERFFKAWQIVGEERAIAVLGAEATP